MKEEVKYSVIKFRDALKKLEAGILQAVDELDTDGVIQRFEFTFETMWKALKIFLTHEGIACDTPRNCLKEAFRLGLLEKEKIFLDMLEDRNKTSHIYNKEVAEEIVERVKIKYLPVMRKVLNKLWRR